MQASADTCRDQKRALDALELESQATGSLWVWVLGTELPSFRRVAYTFNHQVIPQVLEVCFKVLNFIKRINP